MTPNTISFDRKKCFLSVLVLCAALLMLGVRPANSHITGETTEVQASHAPGPRPKKYLGRYQILANDPLQINAKIKGVHFNFNSSLMTRDENWLDQLSLNVKNVSSKPIFLFSLELMFPETKTAVGHLMAYILRYGGDPKVARGPIEEPPLAPGDEVHFDMAGPQYDKLKRFVENRVPITYINAVQLRIGLVVFDDDTAWESGSIMRRDPNSPGRWLESISTVSGMLFCDSSGPA